MSKAGNNFYYLQDELGSSMYMTGTDGASVSTYAFDDFGRNIDPFTGKVRKGRNQNASKHAYTTNGNIIQPFAFTGYQEDEVSGLKFAQARVYSADNGRFQSEDNVKGFIDSPFTLNHYGYCFDNPAVFVDNDGNWPTVLAGAAIGGAVGFVGSVVGQAIKGQKIDLKEAGKTAIKGAVTGAVLGTGVGGISLVTGGSTVAALGTVGTAAGIGAFQGAIGAAVTGGSILNGALSGAINATAITAAAIGITVVTGGTSAALAVGMISLMGGAASGIKATSKGESFEKGVAKGMADYAVIATSVALNPAGTLKGIGGQIFTDMIKGKKSELETYAASALGGAVSNYPGIKFGNTVGGAAASLTNDLLSNAVGGGEISGEKMYQNAKVAAMVGALFDLGMYGLEKFAPGYIKEGARSFYKPFDFSHRMDARNVLTMIDDFGRAAFGLNGGSSIIQNYLDVYFTDMALNCGD